MRRRCHVPFGICAARIGGRFYRLGRAAEAASHNANHVPAVNGAFTALAGTFYYYIGAAAFGGVSVGQYTKSALRVLNAVPIRFILTNC